MVVLKISRKMSKTANPRYLERNQTAAIGFHGNWTTANPGGLNGRIANVAVLVAEQNKIEQPEPRNTWKNARPICDISADETVVWTVIHYGRAAK